MATNPKKNITVNNPTAYSDKPQQNTGTPQIIVQDIQVRQVQRTSIDIDYFRGAQRSADSRYWPNRSRLYDIYDDVLLDGHLSGIIQKRIDAVLNKVLFYRDKAGEEVEGMKAFIRTREMKNIKRAIMQSILWGISGLEFVPGKEVKTNPLPRKHIKPKWQVVSIEQEGIEGFDYTQIPNLWIIGEPEDLGILLKCAPYAIYKRGGFADWATYIEIFGQPTRIIKYDAYDEQTKIELKKVLDESGSALALMIPKQADFEMKDGKGSAGDGKLQEAFVNSCNNEMSVIVLGNTETTTNGKTGTNAKAKTHQEQQLEITKSDLDYVLSYLNDPHFFAILKSYGLPVEEGGYFEFNKDVDIEQLAARVEIDKEVAAMVPVPQSYWYDTYGIPMPKDGEAVTNTAPEPPEEPGDTGAEPPEEPQPKKGKQKQEQDTANLASAVVMELRKMLPDFFGQAPE